MAKDRDSERKTGKDGKKNTSLRLEARTLKALKIRAIEEDSSVQKIIETLIEDYLNQAKRRDK